MLRILESELRLAFLFFWGVRTRKAGVPGEARLIEERIEELLAPIAAELGVDVLKVSLGGGDHRQLLRVVVDQAGGVPFETLERVSRALSLQLDAEDLIPGRYHLEVTSPGLDWPLETEADFRRHEGEMLRVSMADGTSVCGRNLGPAEGGVRIADESGAVREIALDETTKIVRMVDWGRSDGRKKRKSR